MIKALLFVSLLALVAAAPAAEAEAAADPYYIFGGYPATYSLPLRTVTHAVQKTVEDADTETVAEKKPATPVVYSYGHPYNYNYLYGANYPVVNPVHGLSTYRIPTTTYHVPPITVRGKRDAGAEPEPEADADPWIAYGGYPYTGYHGLTYGYHPYYAPTVVKPVEAEADVKAVEDKKTVVPAVYGYGYPNYYPYGVNYPVGKPIVSPLSTYGYPHHFITKRDATAEPAADPGAKADPWLTYGYGHSHGYAHPYPYGGYRHGYSNYYVPPYRYGGYRHFY